MSPARKATSARSGASSKTRKSTAKKTPVKKTAAKTSARKATTQRAGAKKAASQKAGAKKAASQKTGAKKVTAKKTPAMKPTAKKTAARKPVAKKLTPKAAPKKPLAKKTTAPKAPAADKKLATAAAKPAIKKPVSRPAPPAPPKKKVRAAKLDKAQLEKIRANLVEKQIELEARKKELDEASFTATQSDITGEVGLDEDFADAGTATFERERDLSIRNNIRDLIDQVTRAMQRIDEGVYGTCERCGQPIDATRLKELPHASLCLDCKRREERAR